MIRRTRLAAALAFGAGLMMAGAAPAQTQGGGAPDTPPQSDQPAAQSPTISLNPPADPDSNQHVYSVSPPAGSSDPDIPGVVGGYARSVAGCVIVGCDDAPQVGDQGPLTPQADEPPPPPNNVPPSSVPPTDTR
jgi:hypothetical protein